MFSFSVFHLFHAKNIRMTSSLPHTTRMEANLFPKSIRVQVSHKLRLPDKCINVKEKKLEITQKELSKNTWIFNKNFIQTWSRHKLLSFVAAIKAERNQKKTCLKRNRKSISKRFEAEEMKKRKLQRILRQLIYCNQIGSKNDGVLWR